MTPVARAALKGLICAGALAALAGCASVTPQQGAQRVNEAAAGFTQGRLQLAHTPQARADRAGTAQALLSAPLGQKEAVQLAMLNSAALQALLAQGWADAADAAQTGRIANPVFSFERMHAGDSLDLGRALSVGLLDLLTLPARQGIATQRTEAVHLRLTGEVVDGLTAVRQAWVRAVAAQQAAAYAQQVYDSAEAGAELARRMRAAGNFSRLEQAREQVFYADAGTRLASARHQATASREELVRLLGLDEAQAEVLRVPERLPDVPPQALAPDAAGAMATRTRLDIRLAQSALEAAARAQGLGSVASLVDIELSARRHTQFEAGGRASPRGWEVAVALPVFDGGGLQRAALQGRTLAAANQLEATVRAAGSSLRQSYSAYRTAHDIARHYRDEVVPLRKLMSDENQLRYNGMLIGVFELLADARDQVGTVLAALEAQQQFWLADAALQASLIGRPGADAGGPSLGNAPDARAAAGH